MTLPPLLTDSGRAALLAQYRDGLLNDVLPFWLNAPCVDPEHGGYFTALDRDGSLLDSDKAMWPQGRFAWLLSRLYNTVEQRDDWLQAAESGIDFISQHGFDPNDGRMWFHVTRDGHPIRKRRYAFTESFAAIAFAEFAKASGRQEYADKAIAAWHAYKQQMTEPVDPSPKFTGTRPMTGIGFPMIGLVTLQELRQSIGFDETDAEIDAAIEMIEDRFVRHDIGCVMEAVHADGSLSDHFDGRTLCPGHAIEGAWFIMREGKHRNDSRMIKLGLQMLDCMWERGWDNDRSIGTT
jgi:N-acylglucosamine 2-epimerase